MKRILLTMFALAALLTGCSTQKSVTNLQGKGTKQTFDAPFDAVWRAAVDAAQQGDLQIVNADRSRGYISAQRGVHVESFGENVGVWVTSLSPSRAQVEVVSRQAGPAVLWLKNWENEILRAVAANLTREGVGGTGTGVEIHRDTTTAAPERTP